MRENLHDEKDGVFEVGAGCEIGATIREAIALSGREKRPITFEFNGVIVTVDVGSNPSLIYRDWSRALNGYIDKRVGPTPPELLTAAQLAHDADVESQNEARRAASQAEYDRRAAEKKAATDSRLAQAPALLLSDADGWQKFKDANRDGYGGAVVTYAEQWGRLMQLDIDAGAKLEAIAEATSSEADTDGITGFMYGCAVSMLSKCWQHGEALRRWHNLKTQIGNEGERANESGGVLNPALLNIG